MATRAACSRAFCRVTHAWKIRPNSMTPNNSNSSNGRVRANSTRVCPGLSLGGPWRPLAGVGLLIDCLLLTTSYLDRRVNSRLAILIKAALTSLADDAKKYCPQSWVGSDSYVAQGSAVMLLKLESWYGPGAVNHHESLAGCPVGKVTGLPKGAAGAPFTVLCAGLLQLPPTQFPP